MLAESELNRAQLVQEFQALANGVHSLASQVRTASSFVSATASLVAGVVSFRRKTPAPAAKKPSWLQTVLKGAGLISTFWQTFNSQGCDRDGL